MFFSCRYSLDSDSESYVNVDGKSAFQLLEEAELRISISNQTTSPRAKLLDRIQCNETCILFSGCLILEKIHPSFQNEHSPSSSKDRMDARSREGLLNQEFSTSHPVDDEQLSARSIVHEVLLESSQEVCRCWSGCVCVGGTAFGGLLVWGARGPRDEQDRVVPWHLLQAHKVRMNY